jgi:hypothetical protein
MHCVVHQEIDRHHEQADYRANDHVETMADSCILETCDINRCVRERKRA